jgi:hypothetical protein
MTVLKSCLWQSDLRLNCPSAMFMRQGKLDRVTYVMLGRFCRQFVSTFDFLSAMLMRQG